MTEAALEPAIRASRPTPRCTVVAAPPGPTWEVAAVRLEGVEITETVS